MTYTYEATNEGDTDLRNDTANPGVAHRRQVLAGEQRSSQPDTVGDGVPSAPYNVGDDNDDDLINPGETWRVHVQHATIAVPTR